MLQKHFTYPVLVVFLIAIFLIVFLQFNSNRSINQLINGNENLINELRLKNELQKLQKSIVTLESKVKDVIVLNDTTQTNRFQQEITHIKKGLTRLDSMIVDKATDPLLSKLRVLVNEKIQLNNAVLDTFSKQGKMAAEKVISRNKAKQLIDSIEYVSKQIDDMRQEMVTRLTKQADADGARAKTLGSILALIAALAAIFTFGYVSNKVRQQQQLILQLNISEKKAREAKQVKENFLANMSHEIRTPMNAILGFANLLQRQNLDSESLQQVQAIRKSGENLLTIINDILDLSKIEAGMMRIESAPFSIRSVVHSIETMFKAKADEKQLQLSTSVDESLPKTLEGDATRLIQILVNLVGNALKFTNKGSIAIKVANEGNDGKMIQTGIIVSDTGIGIEKRKHQHIFERFQQAEDSVTRKYGGTGLGLSIIKDLVLLQHGSINVESEPGKGTSFRLIIPYKIAAEQFNHQPSTEVSLVIQQSFENTCILVVEDNEINQTLITHLFKTWQLHFDMVNNGREAIAILQTKKYNLILMDIQMPEMDGYTATQEIRGTLKLTTPIIAMTAHAMAGEREKCLSYGMNEYISKPVNEQELFSQIARFIKSGSHVQLMGKGIENPAVNDWQYINLQYMNEISGGNKDYEKKITQLFIEAIPEELRTMENSFSNKDYSTLKQTAHNMKTSVSVMGLTAILEPHLDAIEYNNLDDDLLTEKINSIKNICRYALAESKKFLATF